MKAPLAAIALLVAAAALGCATNQPPPPTPQEIERQHLPFIQDGVTTREDALLRLGIPSAQFEGEHIFTYRLCFDGKKLDPVTATTDANDPRYRTWPGAAFNLVLVFDARHVLQKHSFLKVR